MGKPCPFCLSQRKPLNLEHVIARKFAKDLPPPNSRQERRFVHTDIARQTRRVHDELDIKVRCQCPDCNAGWMDTMDHEARPILKPMIWGQATALSAGDRRLLARWASKLALVADYTHRSAERLVLPETIHTFYATREPPDNARICLAAYGSRDPLLDLIAAPVRIGSDDDQSHGHLVVVRLCHVVLKTVIPWIPLPPTGLLGDDRLDVPIWPPRRRGASSWPPKLILRDRQELLAYAATLPPP